MYEVNKSRKQYIDTQMSSNCGSKGKEQTKDNTNTFHDTKISPRTGYGGFELGVDVIDDISCPDSDIPNMMYETDKNIKQLKILNYLNQSIHQMSKSPNKAQ